MVYMVFHWWLILLQFHVATMVQFYLEIMVHIVAVLPSNHGMFYLEAMVHDRFYLATMVHHIAVLLSNHGIFIFRNWYLI